MRREIPSIAAMAALLVGSQIAAIALSPLFFGAGFQAFQRPEVVTNTVISLLLIALAFYDAWAVYRTKHMITLADELTSQRLPILLVIPKKAGYSFRQQKSLKEQVASGEEREAMFVGLGDLIIPGIMAVSAFTFPPLKPGATPADPWVPDIRTILGVPSNLLIALFVVFGCLVGFLALMRFVLRGNPQAGLPLLNGGALVAFVIMNLLVYGTVHIL